MRKNYILLFFILSTGFNVFAGGPWTPAKGTGYFKLSEWWIVYDEHFTDTGLRDPNVTTGIFSTYFYAEYGLTNRLTGLFNGPIFTRNYMNNLISRTTNELIAEGEAINSIGDIDLGLKYALVKPGKGLPISASLILGLPTGKSIGGKAGNLQTGDGEFNQMIQIDAGGGYTIGSINSYLSTYVGFNNRTEGFSEEFRYGIETGFGFMNQKLWTTLRLTGIESLKNGDTAATTNNTSIFANNTEFTSYTIEANYYVTKKVGISASFAGAFRGEIIAAAPSYSFGIFLDLK